MSNENDRIPQAFRTNQNQGYKPSINAIYDPVYVEKSEDYGYELEVISEDKSPEDKDAWANLPGLSGDQSNSKLQDTMAIPEKPANDSKIIHWLYLIGFLLCGAALCPLLICIEQPTLDK